MPKKHKLSGKTLSGEYKTSKPKPVKEKKPDPGKWPAKIGIAKRNCSAYLCGKEYKFEKGKEYTIDEQEVWIKLTNPRNQILVEK